MKLVVRVIEAMNLPPTDPNGLSDPYVRLQLGKQRFRTKVIKKSLNPKWDEEFSFKVDDLKEELVVSVMDEDKFLIDDFVGQLKVPMSLVFDEEIKSLGTAWYSLQPKSKKTKYKEPGEIRLSVYFELKTASIESNVHGDLVFHPRKFADSIPESPSRSSTGYSSSSSPAREEVTSVKDEKSGTQKSLTGRIAHIFNKSSDTSSTLSRRSVDSDQTEISKEEVIEVKTEDQSSDMTFDEAMKKLQSSDQGSEIPTNLPGGLLVDQYYTIAPEDLNTLLFSSESNFLRSLADVQVSTELQLGPWKFENGGESLKRLVSYVKAPSKLIKAVKAFEEQTYLKADGKNFAVLVSVSTPDVVYGSTFRVEILYTITPGPELPSGEQCSHLVISWRMNFLQSTMMKGMIENGARQGVKDSFEQYANLLAQDVKPVDPTELSSNKEQALASLQAEPQSDWKLAVQYFANFTVVSTVFIGLYVLVHIWLAAPSTIQGLEFAGLDLPDSIGEFVVCAVLVLQGERMLGFISRFIKARAQKGSDHGIKAQGDGWLLTVALIEGNNLASVDSGGYSDPYVVFTCNGKVRTSSIKFQKSNPLWNEIFEFDAMDDPPSVMDVEVYDFDGPFDATTCLGHAEINFLKVNISDLADIWVPLEGKLASACQSKLHLRIFLDNTRGGNVAKDYLNKMEKEVGKKINMRSPQTNSAFQKLFALPPEEFLINDFTCHLKRKMPLQGRLFLSPRIIGFHANLFGKKTKFFFLWEDIEEIQVVPPTFSSMGSPIVVITLRPGRGVDARHGAKTQDEQGRLKFHFQSFVSFSVAHRTIMALWKARSLTPEQKMKFVEQESETKTLISEDSCPFLVVDDVSMSEIYSCSLPIPASFLMEIFSGGEVDRRVMENSGCLNYSYTPWVSENSDISERAVYYKFEKHISSYKGEVTSTQQRSPLLDGKGWVVEEVLNLHGVPLGDYFNIHIRYHIEDLPPKAKGCRVQVFFGVEWLKSTKNQKRITKNILQNLQERLKVTFSLAEKELLPR
ncbi:putative C2 domain, GRAM domain-containing protein [Medicago truncatula]|uniref:C2 and GRAM domain plant-like protein n=1 Tax=Medicago truncatula TaxID=3880 RepID=G7IQ41_MEDTR|nr:C2 and GRAM domain-containing protein At1g03370 [Medicago truncatula]AES64583.2 C2 and GRAM domain plant-like protein [Medicago truncatula]RHN72710.1 putative C2 domain, GRAM domain-containing protein [Medicago truncatula]